MNAEEERYKRQVELAEAEYGRDSLMTGDALVNLARYYESVGLLDAASECDERIHAILERYLRD